MPKARVRAGVSRQVKFSQPGPQGGTRTTVLNQPALARRREAATKTHSDILQGTSSQGHSWSKRYIIIFILYLGLGDEGKRVLEEFCGAVPSEPTTTGDSEPLAEDAGLWETLEQEGTSQGFIDDIQGLLNGR